MMVGVLSLQGDFKEHLASLEQHGMKGLEVRTKDDLRRVDALILPGGESTTISKLLVSTGLDEAIVDRVQKGMPVWGTCAGAILLSKKVITNVPLDTHLKLIDVEMERNSYGRQTESFITALEWDQDSFQAFFIRAPRVRKVGRGVKVLLEYKNDPVLLRSKNVLISTFHTELFFPNRVLEYFVRMGGEGS
ncbi:MAG: pyridoxal 5'-phosphate synthase glutaminase subunit PdxT [Candidatus Altimarinota bacterium]